MSAEAVGEPLADLAAKRLGGMVLAASDEFFAPKERLLEPAPPVFMAGRYTDRGKWMDGWETRRRRDPGNDWALVRLGLPGVVRAVRVDTTHFRGNHPAACSLFGIAGDPDAAPDSLLSDDAAWVELLAPHPLEPDAQHRIAVEPALRVTHVRLWIHPDGGVARLRVLGEPMPDLRQLAGRGSLDLAAAAAGAEVVACSDMAFGSSRNLLLPGDAVDMGDGWETRRRRGPGHDWAVVRLAAEGTVDRVEVGTTHYKGNYPDRCSVEATRQPEAGPGEPSDRDGDWWTLVPETRLGPHRQHVFTVFAADAAARPATHVRLSIHPDGGISRLRVIGQVSDAGWDRWGVRWLNALPAERAESELHACCASRQWAAGVAAARPFADAAALAASADAVWESLGPDDWLEAFAAHPRIGDRVDGSSPSAREQAGVGGADGGVLEALAEGNREYERRFGHVFLISASGRGAGELLAALRERLGNDPEAELRIAAAEQGKITRLRLRGMLRA
jgi:allantoicase